MSGENKRPDLVKVGMPVFEFPAAAVEDLVRTLGKWGLRPGLHFDLHSLDHEGPEVSEAAGEEPPEYTEVAFVRSNDGKLTTKHLVTAIRVYKHWFLPAIDTDLLSVDDMIKARSREGTLSNYWNSLCQAIKGAGTIPVYESVGGKAPIYALAGDNTRGRKHALDLNDFPQIHEWLKQREQDEELSTPLTKGALTMIMPFIADGAKLVEARSKGRDTTSPKLALDLE